jgi:hypothetical protein
MLDRLTYTERAFALAQSGDYATMHSIRLQLKAEGYSDAGHLHGGSIRQQLIKLIAAAKISR